MGHDYDREFFLALRDEALRSAGEIVPLVFDLVQPRSVIDVGCATGTWLVIFARHGVEDYLGVDAFPPVSLLEIARERFIQADLTRPLAVGRRFDLAISLETAEHLPESAATGFIESLTRLAPVVLFSAAIPGQGGTGHLNEQWPDYWARLFADSGFEPVDVLRPLLWNNDRVAVWYAQNTILYVEHSRRADFPRLALATSKSCTAPAAVVHPRLFGERSHRLSETLRAEAEATARVASLTEELSAERQVVQVLRGEAGCLKRVATAQQARVEKLLVEVAAYEAHAAELRAQAELASREVRECRAEIQRLKAEMSSALRRHGPGGPATSSQG